MPQADDKATVKAESGADMSKGKEDHSRDKKRSKDDRSRDKDRDRDRDKDRDRDRGKDKDRDKERDRHRDRKKDSRSDRDRRSERSERDSRSERDRSRRDSDRSRPSRTRERDVFDEDKARKDKDKERSSRRGRSRSRSRSRDRRRSSRRDRSRSRSADRHRSRRRRSPSRGRRSPSRSKRRGRSNSTDEFGGYVPRKRQEAPSNSTLGGHPIALPNAYSASYVDPYAALRSKTITSSDPEELARQMQEQQLKARQLVLQQQAASATAAASKTQREVYVGNLVSGLVAEDALRQLFNSTMRAAFPDKIVMNLDPVVAVSLHSEGRYAFVELRTPEMATASLQLSNQVQLLGQPISVGRPSGYVDPSTAQSAAAAAAAALAAYQGGSATEAQEQLARAQMGLPPAMQSTPAMQPTQFLQIGGMVTADVLADDDEYTEVIDDVREECGKSGVVVDVKVPRPKVPSNAAAEIGQNTIGLIFVCMANVDGATAAKDAIHGRMFAGATVEVAYVSGEKYAKVVAALG